MYPALAVTQALSAETEILWVGSQGGIESTLVQRAGVSYEEIPAAGVHGVGVKRLPKNLGLIVQGFRATRRILARFNPDVILLTGGYLAVPIALAARGIPLLVVVPDIEPGLAVKTVSRFAKLIAVPTTDSLKYFPNPKKVFVSGYPTRMDLTRWDQASARKTLKLDNSSPVVLVFGGSKGAHSINQALIGQLPSLLNMCQVIHISGDLDWPIVDAKRKELTVQESSRYHAFPYLHEEMGAALASADLVVSRAGASILGEFPLHGLPALLVPYPYAWRYQKVNAEYLASNGAAVVLEDKDLEQNIFTSIKQLLDDPMRLSKMRNSMKSLARPQAAAMIGQRLVSLVGERS